MTQSPALTRRQIRSIFARHRGAAYQLAASMGISRVTLGTWLRGGMTSQRIQCAATDRALELLAEENSEKETPKTDVA